MTLEMAILLVKLFRETYPALLELSHTNDFRAISLCIGVPIFLRSGEGLATNMTNKGHTCRKGC